MKYFSWKNFHRLIGIVIFIFIIIRLDLKSIINLFKDIKIGFILIAVVSNLFITLFRSIRWNYLLRLHKINCNVFEAWKMYMSGNFLGLVTPGRIGELVKIFYLKTKYNSLSYGKLLANVLSDRFLDLSIVFLVSILGVLVYFAEYLGLFFIILTLVVLIIVAVYRLRGFFTNAFEVAVKKTFLEKIKAKIDFEMDDLISGFKELKTKQIFYPILYNLLVYFLFYLQAYLISLSLSINISIFYLAFSLSIAMLLSLLPISIAGVGIRDIVLIFFFSKLNLSSELAVSFSIMYLFVFIFTSAFIGLFTYLHQPIKLKYS